MLFSFRFVHIFGFIVKPQRVVCRLKCKGLLIINTPVVFVRRAQWLHWRCLLPVFIFSKNWVWLMYKLIHVPSLCHCISWLLVSGHVIWIVYFISDTKSIYVCLPVTNGAYKISLKYTSSVNYSKSKLSYLKIRLFCYLKGMK